MFYCLLPVIEYVLIFWMVLDLSNILYRVGITDNMTFLHLLSLLSPLYDLSCYYTCRHGGLWVEYTYISIVYLCKSMNQNVTSLSTHVLGASVFCIMQG